MFQRGLLIFLIAIAPIFSNGMQIDTLQIRKEARDLYDKGSFYFENGLFNEAINSYYLALDLRKKAFDNRSRAIGQIYSRIAYSFYQLGQYDKAISNYELAKGYYVTDDEIINDRVANLYQFIGITYRAKLDFSNALLYFQESLNYFTNKQEISNEKLAEYAYNIAEVLYTSNQYNKSLELSNKYKDIANLKDQILYSEIISFIYHEKGDFQNAKKYYEKVIELSRKELENNSIDLANRYLNYSILLISMDEFMLAKKYLSSAFEIIQKIEPVYGETIAEYYRVMGNFVSNKPIESNNKIQFNNELKQKYNKEINWYKKGLAALKYPPDFSKDSIEKIDNVISLMSCIDFLKLIGDGYSDLADVESSNNAQEQKKTLLNALENYQIVGALIQKSRRALSSDDSKIQLSELENATFHKLVQVAQKLFSITNNKHYIEIAFRAAEQSKSSAIFDKISDDLARENSLIPDSLIVEENLLNSTVTFYNEKIFEENNRQNPDTELVSNYKSLVFNAKEKTDSLNRHIEKNFPKYFELKYSGKFLNITDIQTRLSGNEVLLEYVYTESEDKNDDPKLLCFLIQKNNVLFESIEIEKSFSIAIESMFHFMSNKDFMNTRNNESVKFCSSAHQLYSKLILPFKKELNNKDITVIPDGKLNYIVFDALLENLPDTSKTIQFNKLDYLIKSYNINYSNSANLLYKTPSTPTKFKVNTVAFAPEYNNETFEVGVNKQLSLVPLPGVQKEVQHISETLKTSTFIGEEASERNFRKHAEEYDILHLAMHAFINDSLPKFSRLAFYQNKKAESIQEEGWVNTADIYNLKLAAKLTVLSACNTGIGQLKKGEGIMSLARGFQYAGCPSIIMSRWEVEDLAGTKIMSSFYKNFKSGKSKGESLREAKLEYLKSANSRQAHPHYWLSFVSIGDDSPLFKSYDFYFFILLIVALSGIAIDQILRMKKARKKRAS